MTHFAYNLRNALLFLTDAPQRALTRVSTRFSNGIPQIPPSLPPPAHVTARLEAVFEALGALSEQPSEAAALALACDTLDAELPAETLVAGLYDIDADQMRFVAARGEGGERLRHTSMPVDQCLGAPGHGSVLARGTDAPDWIGRGGPESSVLVTPIVHDGALLGVLALADPEGAHRFDHHDLDLVCYVAEQLADVIYARRRQRAVGT